jgi:hypothetical protein
MLANFARYRAYLAETQARFPPAAHALATSDWYYNPNDHRCPHDAWLEWVKIEEPASGDRHEIRAVDIRIRLLGAYHDGYIEFRYPGVTRYTLELERGDGGHRDWRYDEFRVSEAGNVVHEIEWAGMHPSGRWMIEASEVHYAWLPMAQ